MGIQTLENKNQWHLPSQEVLNAMFENKNKLSGFTSESYWSSSQLSSNFAWFQYFFNGFQNDALKLYGGRVRAVRALPKDHSETENVFRVGSQEYQAYQLDAPEKMAWWDAVRWCESLN